MFVSDVGRPYIIYQARDYDWTAFAYKHTPVFSGTHGDVKKYRVTHNLLS